MPSQRARVSLKLYITDLLFKLEGSNGLEKWFYPAFFVIKSFLTFIWQVEEERKAFVSSTTSKEEEEEEEDEEDEEDDKYKEKKKEKKQKDQEKGLRIANF